ncbi:MAG: TonB-dependent receptor [Hyphomicrobiales bacterium]|nr:TonB-dependent receptor [Hyphomicrobiales bacterium]
MVSRIARLALMASASTSFFVSSLPAQAQEKSETTLPDLVITATRTPLAITRAGSAITIIDAKEIQAYGASSIANVLRTVPGLDVTESGGLGTLSNVSLRGSKPDQTLVLLDGVRIGDPSSIGGEIDLGSFSVTDVERIEVLRGPQSALYGSDAMGGVINIIMRKGTLTPRAMISTEAGSYGTISTQGAVSGATDRLNYAFSFNALHSDGYSRYGTRISRITSSLTAPLERDPTDKFGFSARIGYRLSDQVDIEASLSHHWLSLQLDNPGAFDTSKRDNTFDIGRTLVTEGNVRTKVSAFDGLLLNSVTLFATRTARYSRVGGGCYDPTTFATPDCNLFYSGSRIGAEYQGDLKLGSRGTFAFGLRTERETANTAEEWLGAFAAPKTNLIDKSQTTNSVFALQQLRLTDRWDVSVGGRIDAVAGSEAFPTWRATTAYNIFETGTKLRASVGTGAKAPSLFQRFSQYGDPGLGAETNFGVDTGIDQSFYNDRIKIAATLFDTHYRDLIDFDFTANNGQGAYFNVGHARIRGLEFSADADLVPDVWRARATYTYMQALDTDTGQALLRRPRHKGSLGVIYSGIPKWELEGRLIMVGTRPDVINDYPYSRVQLGAYARLDARAEYKLDKTFSVFARAENLTNTHYEEIRDYATAGRSFFGGVKASW